MKPEEILAREIVTDWLGMFDPPPQIDFQQSELLQGAIASALKATRQGSERAYREMRDLAALAISNGRAG